MSFSLRSQKEFEKAVALTDLGGYRRSLHILLEPLSDTSQPLSDTCSKSVSQSLSLIAAAVKQPRLAQVSCLTKYHIRSVSMPFTSLHQSYTCLTTYAYISNRNLWDYKVLKFVTLCKCCDRNPRMFPTCHHLASCYQAQYRHELDCPRKSCWL